MPKFRTKNALFVHFWTGTRKKYCHIWNKHPRICLNVTFCEKTKMSKFLTKNALFRYFWDRILKTIVIFEIDTLEFANCQKWVFNSYSEFSYRVRFYWRSISLNINSTLNINPLENSTWIISKLRALISIIC